MNRLRALLLVGLVIAIAATSAASGQRTQPVLRRPNPLFVSIGLDYVSPIPAPGGGYALLDPERKGVIKASVVDLKFLEYERRDDLGGFIAAPIGWLATGNCYPPQKDVVCPGRPLTGSLGRTGVPFYKNQAHSKVVSYTYLHGIGRPRSCVACGAVTFPGGFPSTAPVFPANGGFGGQPKPPHHKPTKPTKPSHPVKKGSAGDCGTAGISIVSNLPKCRIYVVNQEPGDGTFERMTITNTTNVKYVLSLEATGTPNRLWQDLEMGIWERGNPAPTPLPPLHFWTDQYNQLITLDPGQVVHYVIELYLPLTAGNADQHLAAVLDFNWRAVERTPG